MKDIWRALRYLGSYRLTAVGAVVSLMLVTAANLLNPQLLRFIIDRGISTGSAPNIAWGVAAVVAVALLQGLFNFTQGFWSEKASQGVAYDVRNQLFVKIQSLSFSYLDTAQTGQLMTRATSDVDLVRQFTGVGFFQLLNALIMILGSIVLLFAMNARLALVTLAVIPFLLLALVQFVRTIAPLFGQVQARLGRLNTVLQENLAGVRVVKAFGREPYESERFGRANAAYLEQNLKIVRTFATNFPLIFLISNLGTVAIIWVGGRAVIGGGLSVGELVAFNTYLTYLLMPLLTLGFLGGLIASASTSAHRIFEVLDAANDVVERPDALALTDVQGEVRFEHVSFRYPGQEQDVLHDLTFTVRPGQTVAITGPTGSGKSSIINLLPRFYDVTAGAVCIDGHDVRDLTLASLRAAIGIVLQETTLFSGSVRDNIAYGRPSASQEEVEAAARAAQAHDFIRAMPEGYATRLGERGLGLSGGQRQRIAIARALLLHPRILILDDSTSAVDTETEYQIQQALDNLMQEPTSFVIAHRISTVQNADLILVLEGGRIAAQGRHEELLRESCLYNEIVQSQLRSDRPQAAGTVAGRDC
jgi:ATP-binding cassette subfamily B protein